MTLQYNRDDDFVDRDDAGDDDYDDAGVDGGGDDDRDVSLEYPNKMMIVEIWGQIHINMVGRYDMVGR